MADARCVERWDEFVNLNPNVDYQGRVVDIKDHFSRLPSRLCLLLQWMNESITRED